MENRYRTTWCGDLRKEHVGKEVVLNGWVQKRRDLGGVIFIDLRDRSGIVQVVGNPEYDQQAYEICDRVRTEYVLAVRGEVVERSAETVNPKLDTGEVEVAIKEIEIINRAETPPFLIEDGD